MLPVFFSRSFRPLFPAFVFAFSPTFVVGSSFCHFYRVSARKSLGDIS
jgi:hypothetical protein